MKSARERAALIDQSWYCYAGKGRRYHVVRGSAPACNRRNALLNENTECDADTIPPMLRCARRGCAAAWPAP